MVEYDDHRLGRVEHAIGVVQGAVGEMRDAVSQIADAVTKIARLEERHSETREGLGRAFRRIEEMEKEQSDQAILIERINGQLAPLQETRKWVVGGIISIVGIVGTAVITLVVIAPWK